MLDSDMFIGHRQFVWIKRLRTETVVVLLISFCDVEYRPDTPATNNMHRLDATGRFVVLFPESDALGRYVMLDPTK